MVTDKLKQFPKKERTKFENPNLTTNSHEAQNETIQENDWEDSMVG